MSKGVKTKKVSHGISQDDMNMLNEMFNQMTGCSNAEPEIIIPKYSDILDNLKKYVKIYQTLINFSEVKNIINIEEFEKFIQSIKDIIDKYTLTDEIKTNSNKLNESYKELKKENIIQMIIVTSGNLNRYKVNLEDKNNLKDEKNNDIKIPNSLDNLVVLISYFEDFDDFIVKKLYDIISLEFYTELYSIYQIKEELIPFIVVSELQLENI